MKDVKLFKVFGILVIITVVFLIIRNYSSDKILKSPEQNLRDSSEEIPEDFSLECTNGLGTACCVCNTHEESDNNLASGEYCSLADAEANCLTFCKNYGGIKETFAGPCIDPNTPLVAWCCKCPGSTTGSTKQGSKLLGSIGLNKMCGCFGALNAGTTLGAC
jgi:hypothetical protein